MPWMAAPTENAPHGPEPHHTGKEKRQDAWHRNEGRCEWQL